jgi:hypothetical protein
VAAGSSFLGDDHKTTAEFSDDHKTTAEQGVGSNFSSIKNFHTQPGRDGRKIRAFSISPGALKAFKEPLPADVAEDAEQAGTQGAAEKAAGDKNSSGRSPTAEVARV